MKRNFPKGTTLEEELKKAMERLEALGVTYPDGYFEKLVKKYSSKGVSYPRILMRIGEQNIREHPHYQECLEKKGKLLDYGCGTGDDIRALIKDDYPKNKIKGFDIDWSSINLGFDLYRDKNKMKGIFKVSTKPTFKKETFDIVYSKNVLHVFFDRRKIPIYLDNVYRMLRHGGIIFGATLGTDDIPADPTDDAPPTLLTKDELRKLLLASKFNDIEIIEKKNASFPKNPRYRLWFYGVK